MGLPDLITEIDRVISDRHGEITPDLPILSSARHRRAIQTAYAETKEFDQAWNERRLPATVAAVHVRTAVSALEELIGTVEIEDVLDRVFSSFCVGK
jgi:tRNA modification GTPase